jgi:hypothetical protein
MRPHLLAVTLFVPAIAAAQEVKPILRVELGSDSAIPGQPIELQVTVLAPTWFPSPPVFPSFEIPNVVVRLPEGASAPAREQVEGASWSGVRRVYQLYPMTSGAFHIPPQSMSVTYADPGTRDPVTAEMRTPALGFQGRLPEGAEDLNPFIAANAVSLQQSLDGITQEPLAPGSAVTREVSARIDGASPIFLPALIPTAPPQGFAAYPAEPAVAEREEQGRPSGTRTERIVYIAEAAGRFDAPPIRLAWFNLTTGRIETAEVPGFAVVAENKPGSEAALPRLLAWLAGIALLLVTLVIAVPRYLKWLAGRLTHRRAKWQASEAYAYAQAAAALRNRDAARTFRATDLWNARLPPVPGVPEETALADAFLAFGVVRYGRSPTATDPAVWARVSAALSAARACRRAATDEAPGALPPLNPAFRSTHPPSMSARIVDQAELGQPGNHQLDSQRR